MKKLLLNLLTSKTDGIPSIIRDKTGKISFRRSAAMVVLTAIVAPDVTLHGITVLNCILIVVCLIIPTIPYFMKSDKNNQQPL